MQNIISKFAATLIINCVYMIFICLVRRILRTPRFTPFYVNSGFYYQKYTNQSLFLMEKMLKSISEIAVTHSHQATLTRHITEAHHLTGLQVAVLSQEEFPSGILFHHDKKYIQRLVNYEVVPSVFHMCWTTSRAEKVFMCCFLKQRLLEAV